MKKRILSLALTLVMVMTFLPNTSAKAAATYDVDAAIAYAKAHWNDGVGMCAEFVSKCVKAGGINMKVIATTKSCINAISSASGLPLVEVKLDSKGYALKSANSGILSAGDPVIQKCVNPNCADYGKHPHIMLCGGFDSQGRATFYGHTAAINNKVQQLNVNEAYNHTKACTMKVYTVHLASLDKGGSTGGETGTVSTVLYTGKVHDTDGNLAINDKAAPSPQSSKEIGRIPEGATCVVYTNKVSGNWWWVEYNGIQGWAYGKYITEGAAVKSMQYLDVNGYLDGKDTGNISGAGTVDVYINGFKVANDCSDYYIKWPVGTKYEIKDVRASGGYNYDGLRAGSASGTVGSSGTNVRMAFSKPVAQAYLDLNGYVGGSNVNNIAGYGTVDIYINGSQVANDCTDYYTQWPAGTKYEIKDIKAAGGYSYIGLKNGSLSGTIGSSKVDVRLIFAAAAPSAFEAVFYMREDGGEVFVKSVTQGQAYGTLPAGPAKEGYTFNGWYTDKTGGTKVTSSTIFNGTSDVTLYPRYTQNVVEEPEVPQQYTVYLYMNGYVYKTLTVTNGSTYGTLPSPKMDGYEFLGWYTSSSGGTKVTSSTKVNLTGSQTLFARFEEIPEEGGTITLQIGNPRLTVNGVSRAIDDGGTVPVIRNDRTLLPVRAAIEAMGGTVGWDNTTRTVSLTKDGKTLYLQINSTLCVDSTGKYYALDSAPIILNSRTMLPIRFVVEYFGGTVGWNGTTRTVTIQY